MICNIVEPIIKTWLKANNDLTMIKKFVNIVKNEPEIQL